jgi:hypothetical protein
MAAMPKLSSESWHSPPLAVMPAFGTRAQAYTVTSGWFNHLVIYVNAWLSEFENPNQPERRWTIGQADLPNGEPYQMIERIPVKVTREGDVDFIATFEEANISIGGTSYRDAYQSLICEVLDLFDHFTANRQNLGPEPLRQLDLLSEYIVKVKS